ncbi:MAG: cytochrome c biogenesis protein ResB [Dysgonamonadaceae bacterium]|jgi:cytochrome c biogenesis factor|nr:cytochrome c biogenesis protein ResB [Dysgonamonadaceae bacterium]
MGNGLISSYKTAIVLLAVYAFGLAIATFIEKQLGTTAAKIIIYYSPAFFFLQFLLILNFISTSLKHRLFQKRKIGFMLIHFAFIIILAGAFTTHFFGKEGSIHLREGEKTGDIHIMTNRGDFRHIMPFQIELAKFTITHYPMSHTPSSFESRVIIHADNQSFEKKISMNNTLDFKGYRFFQSSYDKDGKGSILSVNKDVAGRGITYSGYIILAAGFILCFTSKNTRFRQLIRALKDVKK